MLGGARRRREPDPIAVVCRLLTQYLRMQKRAAREEPHLFGPHAQQYFLDTLEMERHEAEMEAAIRKVYGPPAPGEPPHVSTLWTDRYCPAPGERRLFLKWFHEQYPSRASSQPR